MAKKTKEQTGLTDIPNRGGSCERVYIMVVCNSCDFSCGYDEQEEALMPGVDEGGAFLGCPNCETDANLMDCDDFQVENIRRAGGKANG